MSVLTLPCENRAIASADDHQAWLRARATGVTATEVKTLLLHSHHADELLATKLFTTVTGDSINTVRSNKYIAWGRERESIIASTVTKLYPGLQPERRVFHAVNNKQYLASPDMLGYDEDHNVCCGEIKTSSKPIVYPSHEFDKTGYYYQMQWQMFVLDAKYCVYALEQHDNNWQPRDGMMPAPAPSPVQTWIVRRDDECIARLQAVADEFLTYYNSAAATMGPTIHT